MLLTTLLVLGAAAQDTSAGFSGRAGRIRVQVPRIDTAVTIDGRLDEGIWSRAARLTGFSQYQPVDGRPAEEPTEVLVWYGPNAIYFGIRAREVHGNVIRATQANRDNIASEDHIQILLDTNNDRQIAFLFGVNPLGVQQDGTRSAAFGGGAGGFSATGGGFRGMNPLEGNVDLNPDYVFESRGRVYDGGYEIEIRIPFKSLRYQEGNEQTWGIHVLRRVQHSGYQDTWAPAVRANANFLAQGGTLEGLRDLERGLVLELSPTATARVDGVRSPAGRWDYDGPQGELGGDIRWGLRQNLTLNGTFNPDFSQVEADVGQVLLNERFALFYPEKRPFFLDGLELFDTPNQLIYTRRIVEPRGGVKLAGTLGRATVATLIAADDDIYSATGATPVFGVARIKADLGRAGTLGAVLTTREDGGRHSRLAGADVRLYHSRLYYIELQAAQSWTEAAGARSGPLLQAVWDRTGRGWGFHYNLQAIGPEFDAAAGFVNRTGIINASAFNRFTGYGSPGALLQTYTAFVGASRFWSYSNPGDGTIEGGESISPSATLRGGWRLSGSVGRNFFSYEPSQYSGLTVETTSGGIVDTVGFAVPGKERNQLTGSFSVTTPTYRWLTATASISGGAVPIFLEAAPGSSLRLDAAVDLRPTAALRTTIQVSRFTLNRKRDGSRFSSETIPRLKAEYQLSRALFLRVVGQYSARARTALLDRSGNPILVSGVRDAGTQLNELRMDWLLSYRPSPGTLVYLGYGSTLEEPDEFRFRELRRSTDGFFGKVSYLLRM
jgi:hypothetical protein